MKSFIFFCNFTVSPLIRLTNSEVRTRLGGTAALECEVEAFPESVR